MTFQDVNIKKTPLVIGETTYHILFTNRAFGELEDIYGTIDEAYRAVSAGSIKAITTVLWAGLLKFHPELNIETVGEMFDMSQMEELSAVLKGSMEKATPAKKEGKAGKNPKPPTP